jgi:hypothetical protein
MCIGAYFAHGTVGQDVSQSWAQRGLDRIRARRHARRQGSRHGHLAHGGKLPRAEPGTDELRRGAATGPLHQAGRGGDGGSGGADQGAQRPGVDFDRGGAVSDQAAAAARGPDPAGDGRALARHYRPVDCRADCERAGDGGRADARHLRRRHEQDGAGSNLVHD